jgi:hypothetical protein
MKSKLTKIFDEWFDYRESRELESAIYWYDSEIDKIKQDINSSKTQNIGGKSYTFEARNQDFHEKILIDEKFGVN